MKITELLVTEPYGVQTQQLFQEKDELGQILSLVTICMNITLLYTCATFLQPLKQSLYMFRVVRKGRSNIYSQIGLKSALKT